MRASSMEELVPLIALCKAGRVFDVQEWARQGKPVGLPEGASSKYAQRNPLRIAIEAGYHSMVQVLLDAGAPIQEGYYNALANAVELRRGDLAELLLDRGAAVEDVSMRLVVEMWNPETIELFLSRGASITKDSPIAWGLVNKIRPALGLVKRFAQTEPDVQRQAETALRFHASEGNAKWVSLLLWAGADPAARGPRDVDEAFVEAEEDDYENATGFAIIYSKAEVLALKRMLPVQDPSIPDTVRLLERACSGCKGDVLELMLARGHSPKLLPDRGTSGIQSIMYWMSFEFGKAGLSGIDSERAREQMQTLHLFVSNGAKWLPEDKSGVNNVRKYLLKLAPKYTLEFIWMMQEYQAARRQDIAELLRNTLITRWLGEERSAALKMMASLPTDVARSVL